MIKYGLSLCLALSLASSFVTGCEPNKWMLLKELVCYDIKDQYHYNQLKRLETRMNLNLCDAESHLCLTLYQRHMAERAAIVDQVQENLTARSYQLFPENVEVLREFLCFPRLKN